MKTSANANFWAEVSLILTEDEAGRPRDIVLIELDGFAVGLLGVGEEGTLDILAGGDGPGHEVQEMRGLWYMNCLGRGDVPLVERQRVRGAGRVPVPLIPWTQILSGSLRWR